MICKLKEHTPIRMTQIIIINMTKYWRGYREIGMFLNTSRSVFATTPLENSLAFSTKVYSYFYDSTIPYLGLHAELMHAHVYQET